MYHNLLMDCNFEPQIGKADLLFSQALRKTLSLFGKYSSEYILSAISPKLTRPENDIAKTCELVTQELSEIFGKKATDIIINEVKENIEERIGFYSHNQIPAVLIEIKINEITNFIQHLPRNKHVLLLWQNEEFRDQIFTLFFNLKNSQKILFSDTVISIDGTQIISEEQILRNKTTAIQKEIEILNNVCQSSTSLSPPLIGRYDISKWFRDGLADEYLEFRTSHSKYISKPICRLCGLNITYSINEKLLKRLFSCFDYAIVENSYLIYSKK